MADLAYQHTQKILRLVNKSYNCGEGRIDEAMIEANRGDTLASFLRREVEDTTFQEADYTNALRHTGTAVHIAIRELQGVADAIEKELEEQRYHIKTEEERGR